MRMLIVEDEPRLRLQLAKHFTGSGWVVDETGDGAEARFLGSEHPYDMAIVDVGLPGLNGVDVVRHWRSVRREFPVLLLTARSDWQDKVAGLEAGADDYVTKPFYLEEVEARVNALTRRIGGRLSDTVSYGPVLIDFGTRTVCVGDREVQLTAFEYNTLEYLAHRQGQVVSKAELTEHIYSQDFDRESNVIEVFIGRLRKKLDPEGVLKPIATVRGAGYRFALAADAT